MATSHSVSTSKYFWKGFNINSYWSFANQKERRFLTDLRFFGNVSPLFTVDVSQKFIQQTVKFVIVSVTKIDNEKTVVFSEVFS